MRMTYSPHIDAAYLYVRERGRSVRTPHIAPDVIADLDSKGRLLGIEFLHASRHIPRRALAQAVRLPRRKKGA